MPFWAYLLIGIGVLILFGAIVDFFSKKKRTRLDPIEKAVNADESEKIYEEQKIKSSMDTFHN
ncbi:hypothetical protein [Neobacillus sp. D3-1R]|uniref:hypothetical protein n=1 Tax=Neobacillus sp. D3-1R TaxID=3445778 RepID=UPI003FA03747